jgi:hypothetical protein
MFYGIVENAVYLLFRGGKNLIYKLVLVPKVLTVVSPKAEVTVAVSA